MRRHCTGWGIFSASTVFKVKRHIYQLISCFSPYWMQHVPNRLVFHSILSVEQQWLRLILYHLKQGNVWMFLYTWPLTFFTALFWGSYFLNIEMCVVNVSFYKNSVFPKKYYNGRSERKSLKFFENSNIQILYS